MVAWLFRLRRERTRMLVPEKKEQGVGPRLEFQRLCD